MLFYMLGVIVISDYICTRVHQYTIVICTDGTFIDMCLLLVLVTFVWYVIAWMYVTCALCLFEYYVIMDILISWYVSYSITTSSL